MLKKPFAKKDGAKVLIATAVALIFGLAVNCLKLRDKPPSWKVMNGGLQCAMAVQVWKEFQSHDFFR